MSKSLYLLTFVAGGIIGSAVTWQYTKKKYEEISKEEIESVKESFKSKEKELDKLSDETSSQFVNKNVADTIRRAKNKPDIRSLASEIASNEGYTNYSDVNNEKPAKEEKEEPKDMDRPYIISPEEFSEFDDYNTVTLTYYSDGIVADDNDDVVDNVDEIIGFDALNHFGEYPDDQDSVYVRNDKFKSDYEILLDDSEYTDIFGMQ